MKIHITMELYKECQGSWRYQPESKDETIHSLYIRKEAFRTGEQPPKSILVVVAGLEV